MFSKTPCSKYWAGIFPSNRKRKAHKTAKPINKISAIKKINAFFFIVLLFVLMSQLYNQFVLLADYYKKEGQWFFEKLARKQENHRV